MNKMSCIMAAPNGAGNLTRTWLAYAAGPKSFEKLDKFAVELDHALHWCLPSSILRGPLRGRENEIRQDAAILLVGTFLVGNKRLMNATRKGIVREVENQLARSISGAVRYSLRRLRRQAARDAVLFRRLYHQDAGSCSHPSAQKFWGLPLAVQHELALQALHVAVTGKLLSRKQADVAASIVADNISPSDLARQRGISRQAVHQSLQPVRKYLWTVIETLEFPLV